MNTRAQAHLALLGVNFIYGINYVVAKGLMPGIIGASGFILLRVLGAGALFWLLRALRPEPVAWSDAGRLALCSLFGVALNQLMFFHGLMRTSPVNASIIMVATPILVLILSGLLIGERVTWRKALGIALGAAGALALIFLKGDGSHSGATVLGDSFILINATSYGIYLVIVKPLMRKVHAVTVMAWCFLLGSLLVAPFGLAGVARQCNGRAHCPRPCLAMAFVVVMVTFVAYLLNTWALSKVSPTVVGTYVYLQPLMAVVVTWLFMRVGAERLGLPGNYETAIGWQQALCAAAIFTGVHLVNRADRER
ncbi:MAG: DMT family transporter [Flavobacteriales bacterium]|nr:DMT family transporter [Flavobacteriales bacterium]